MSNTEKNADEIIEETLKEIYEDINKEEQETEETVLPDLDDDIEILNLDDDEDFISENEELLDEELLDDEDLDDEDLDDEDLDDEDLDDEDSDDEDSDDENPGDEDADGEDSDDDEDGDADLDVVDEDEDEPECEETEAEKAYRKHKRRKKIGIIAGSIIGVLAVIYIGLAVYFGSHFIFFTTINGTDFSMKSVSQVEAYMEQQVADYVLTMEESDGDSEQISGADISLTYVPGDELQKLVEEQENFLWITALWDHPEIEAKVGVEYDKSALENQIAGLQCLVPENQTASVDAHPEFRDTEFVIIPEVIGTQIDTEKFHKAVTEAIEGFQHTLNFSEAGLYIMPRFLEDAPEVSAARDAMNSYLGANITYDFNPNTEVVDSSVIAQWIRVDADMNVTFDEEAVKAYIASLAEKYDTKGKPRQFTTATGNAVTVEGGAYGWKIDQDAEYAALTANIQNAETVTREPAYVSRAASHGAMDVGSTYAEVDLTNQHMYFIQDGQVVMDSPIVTGNPNRGNATPQGTYTLTYKTRNATLRGTRKPDGTYEYETPVAYWMPFNGGIGFHDATWQSSFGGSRYLSHGSHGCVNMPKDKARQLYELIPEHCPVVCHY